MEDTDHAPYEVLAYGSWQAFQASSHRSFTIVGDLSATGIKPFDTDGIRARYGFFSLQSANKYGKSNQLQSPPFKCNDFSKANAS
jgi:hypothetical protein